MKNVLLFISLVLVSFAFSCKTAKKAQHVQKQIEKKDSTKIVFVTPATQSSELDSLHDMLKMLDSQRISGYQTFSAKIKIDYQGANNGGSVNASLRVREDSLIWISITGPLGIEGLRAMISQDSIIVMNKLNHTLTRRSIGYLQQLTGVPVSFSDLQNIIIGNPVFTSGNISSYKHTHNKWYVSIDGRSFRNFITVIDNNRKLLLRHSRLQDSTATRNRNCDITYNSYKVDDNSGKRFSESRVISVSDKTTLDAKLQFKSYDFGPRESFPFSIPKGYELK